jgi:hypothetical protein
VDAETNLSAAIDANISLGTLVFRFPPGEHGISVYKDVWLWLVFISSRTFGCAIQAKNNPTICFETQRSLRKRDRD